MADHETQSRLLAKLLREVLREESFDNLADLADAVKTRCAKLKIPYPAAALSEAFAAVGSNHPLVPDVFAGLEKYDTRHLIIRESQDIPRDEAATLYHTLIDKFKKGAK